MSYSIGFLMEQNAGHLTNYRNLRQVVEATGPSDVTPAWHELHYRKDGGVIERLHQSCVPFVPTYVTGNSRMVIEFRRALLSQDYDALLTNSWAAMFFAGRIARVPTIIDFDSTPRQIDGMDSYGSPSDPVPVAALKHGLTMRAYRAASLLQAWSNWAKNSAVNDYGVPAEKVIVNPPGVDLDFFRPVGEAKPVGSKLRVVFVGGDFNRKGGGLLLDWFRQQAIGDVELHLATRSEIPRVPGVYMHDVTPNSEQLLQLYQSGDVFVLPSLGECFGIATLEAMACGLPVVVSDAGGTADIVESGGNGFITKAGDQAELALALATVLSDPARRRSMGQASRMLSEGRFDARRNARRTLAELRGLAESHRLSARRTG